MHIAIADLNAPDFVRNYVNLADARLGACAIAASDDFFAPAYRMLEASDPVFTPGKYDEHGKWMDGWETRRRRGPGYDWCVVRLAVRGRIHGVEIDTRHFTGNYPPGAALEACICPQGDPNADTQWSQLLPTVTLQGNQRHYHAIASDECWTHIRISIYPDGGIARLRIFGQPLPELPTDTPLDLAAALNGARVIATNNEHFGAAASLLLPGRGVNMGDGWETRRRREPGHDWCIIELARPALLSRVEVDTAHFKGNYPDSCSLQGAYLPGAPANTLVTQSMFWPELLAPQKLSADAEHHFDTLAPHPVLSHVRFNIFPDGGVSRLRLIGASKA